MFHAFSLKKQLWRRWKRWKSAPWVGACCACASILLFAGPGAWIPERMTSLLETRRLPEASLMENGPAAAVFLQEALPPADESGGPDAKVYEEIRQVIGDDAAAKRRVHYRTVYANGEEIRTEPGLLDSKFVLLLMERHSDWSPRLSEDGDVWLEKRIDDLSPGCKNNAYIGIDALGRLTLFQGPPRRDRALRTFYEIDQGALKSSLPEEMWRQLREGIRIQDADEYRSVLSTFSDYARDGSEQALYGQPGLRRD
ncbi:BofC C-terminal domain-containing protein [Paenibacillus glufosinatiresistens]|uniref:BofC C-terminal domain-containing protein n=1 Tax=Paenibacillus glufosinatiresistens TaxID=3070657 RepID=UPI00286D7F31|nr:BofC C-terminal domain-containing protein [Paenibacillus sp. YX.27]